MMNSEFERNQITRKSVFVKTKRMAPAPPISGTLPASMKNDTTSPNDTNDCVGNTTRISLTSLGIKTIKDPNKVTENKVATENKINLSKTHYMKPIVPRPNFLGLQNKTNDILAAKNNLKHVPQSNKVNNTTIQKIEIRPMTKATEYLKITYSDDDDENQKDDDTSNMLVQLEKQINQMEFDTKMTTHRTPMTPVTPTLHQKALQYVGMESLLNTGVSNVATEGGIGYFEKNEHENDEPDAGFSRNTDTRQSLGVGTGTSVKWKPPLPKTGKPVTRTVSDTKQMKEVSMTRKLVKPDEHTIVKTMKKVLPTPRATPEKPKILKKDDKQRPTDVRKFVEEHLKNRKVNIYLTVFFCISLQLW